MQRPWSNRPTTVAASAAACALLAALGIGCFQPQRVPPPGAIPYQPDASGEDLFSPPPTAPDFSVAPPQTVVPTFAWTPPVPAHAWKYIVLHHTASETGSVDSIHETHLKRTDSEGNNWRGIGYHFVIGNGNGMPDGAIEPTFRWDDQSSGAHAGVGEYNRDGIGVCLVGNFEETEPTPAQIEAVKRLVGALKSEYGLGSAQVLRHGELKATACPGRLFPHEEVAASPPTLSAGPWRIRGW
ncbi:MAG: N-acetylmuramoyl-L-alanine amidase [Planctomycetota bacterium]|nr:MAG: N-acetylmuramoyl-L-alanine amidase [Planctomycetota bacterium]